jgi:hypothetical protein
MGLDVRQIKIITRLWPFERKAIAFFLPFYCGTESGTGETVFQKGPVSGSLFFIVFLCAGLGRCILTRPAPAGSAFFKKLPKGRIQVSAFREFFLKFYDLSDVFRIFESGAAFPGSSYCSKI